jgi:orotidine-5'-phosphate decarboxylase
VTPGVRSGGKSTGDQKRFDSPKNAIESGSDMLVIGRQITEAEDPLRALEEIMIEINAS